jgi:hypothetical protein
MVTKNYEFMFNNRWVDEVGSAGLKKSFLRDVVIVEVDMRMILSINCGIRSLYTHDGDAVEPSTAFTKAENISKQSATSRIMWRKVWAVRRAVQFGTEGIDRSQLLSVCQIHRIDCLL